MNPAIWIIHAGSSRNMRPWLNWMYCLGGKERSEGPWHIEKQAWTQGLKIHLFFYREKEYGDEPGLENHNRIG